MMASVFRPGFRVLLGAAWLVAAWTAAGTVTDFNVARAQTILKVGTLFLPPGKGNLYRGITLPAVMPYHAIFDTMTAMGEDGQVIPWLATEWQSDDAIT